MILWAELSTELLYKKIVTIMENPQYTDQAKTYSQLFRDQKETPLERAVWWIEWILRNPNTSHMRSFGSELSFSELQSIDVIFVFIIIGGVVFWLTEKIIFILVKRLAG